MLNINQYDIVEVELVGDGYPIQKGTRPCIVVSNNTINSSRKSCIVVPITTGNERRRKYKSQLEFIDFYCKGYALCDQIRTIPYGWILYKRGTLSGVFQQKLMETLSYTLGLKS